MFFKINTIHLEILLTNQKSFFQTTVLQKMKNTPLIDLKEDENFFLNENGKEEEKNLIEFFTKIKIQDEKPTFTKQKQHEFSTNTKNSTQMEVLHSLDEMGESYLTQIRDSEEIQEKGKMSKKRKFEEEEEKTASKKQKTGTIDYIVESLDDLSLPDIDCCDKIFSLFQNEVSIVY
jgi:hypothetical protein